MMGQEFLLHLIVSLVNLRGVLYSRLKYSWSLPSIALPLVFGQKLCSEDVNFLRIYFVNLTAYELLKGKLNM